MPVRSSIPIIRTSDNYIKVGTNPYIKWTTSLDTDGVTKLFTMSVKENAGDATVGTNVKEMTF